MRVGRRRVAVVAAVLVAVAAGTGVARAYYAPGEKPLGDPASYFSYCADRQRDVAGITTADLAGTSNGGHSYTIENYVHLDQHPAGQPVAGTTAFVLGKSGIGYAGLGAGPPYTNYDRRILTTQLVEYAPDGSPVQVRCKMRTRESLNRPESEKQRFDGGAPSSIPWGFGAGTATGTPKICREVQIDIATTVWNSLTPAQRDTASFRWAASAGGPANVTVAPEILPINIGSPGPFGVVTPETNVFLTGSQWTDGYNNGVAGYQPGDGFDSVRTKSGTLEIRSAVLNALSNDPLNPIGDRVGGAYYCTFSTPEYLKAVFLGTVTPPAAVS
jgi:hypothetical protein